MEDRERQGLDLVGVFVAYVGSIYRAVGDVFDVSDLGMHLMSLFESGESNGTISLKVLFDGDLIDGGKRPELDVTDLAFAICRGGEPVALD